MRVAVRCSFSFCEDVRVSAYQCTLQWSQWFTNFTKTDEGIVVCMVAVFIVCAFLPCLEPAGRLLNSGRSSGLQLLLNAGPSHHHWGRVGNHMTAHDITWHHMTSHDTTSHMTSHDTTWESHDITWHYMSHMTSHDTTWVTWHHMSHMTLHESHDITWVTWHNRWQNFSGTIIYFVFRNLVSGEKYMQPSPPCTLEGRSIILCQV